MTDIVERLRKFVAGDALLAEEAIGEAADEIERLRKRVSELVKLLDDQFGTPCEQIRHQQEVERLRAGIQVFLDGTYPPELKTAHDQCPHGRYRHETCEACIEIHFQKVLQP